MKAAKSHFLDPVHTSAFSFENAYISMCLGLPSTLIRSNTLSVFTENTSIWKRCWKWIQMKTHTYRISVDTRKRILLKTMTSLASTATLFRLSRNNIVAERAWYGISYASGKRNYLFAVKFCFIQHHDDFIPKTNNCSKITDFIWAVPGPIRARNRFCRQRRFWIWPGRTSAWWEMTK